MFVVVIASLLYLIALDVMLLWILWLWLGALIDCYDCGGWLV